MRRRGRGQLDHLLLAICITVLATIRVNALFDPGEPAESAVAEPTRTYRQTSPAFMNAAYKAGGFHSASQHGNDGPNFISDDVQQTCETEPEPKQLLVQPVCLRQLSDLTYGICTDADCDEQGNRSPSLQHLEELQSTPPSTTNVVGNGNEVEVPAESTQQDEDQPDSPNAHVSTSPAAEDPVVVPVDPMQAPEKQAETLPSDELASLKHRWNFASLDCAAVVHRTNPSAKFASSILSEKKDRYMLSPCPSAQGEAQFVIIELCDEIKIDTLVLANFEFFSRMFKRFRVHVSRNLNGGDDEWLDIGTFRARNVRGLQVFKTPEPAGDARFFRYIRIDFLEHYGSEYYCPLSLVRVYGLTQMDDYVREEEELRKARDAEHAELRLAIEGESVGESTSSVSVHMDDTTVTATSTESSTVSSPTLGTSETASENPARQAVDSSVAHSSTTPKDSAAETHHAPSIPSSPSTSTEAVPRSSQSSSVTSSSSVATSGAQQKASEPALAASGAQTNASHHPGTIVQSAGNATHTASVRQSTVNSTAPGRAMNAANGTASTSNHTHGGSESIYRTITKRLNMLEVNATQQRQVLSDMFTRLERDQSDRISQLLSELNDSNWRQVDSLKRKQQVDLQQALFEFDLHRQQTDVERRALMAQVHLLSAEIMLEKRFGIAQLVLLLGLFVFMALTRGSRASPWTGVGLSRKESRLTRAPSYNRRSSPLSSSRPNTPSSASFRNGRLPMTPKRKISGSDEDIGDATPKQNGRTRMLYDVDRLILPSLKRINGLHPGMHAPQSRSRSKRQQAARLEYSVRLPGGINAKVPARRRGGQLMLPAMSIAIPTRDTEYTTEADTASPTSSSCSSLPDA